MEDVEPGDVDAACEGVAGDLEPEKLGGVEGPADLEIIRMIPRYTKIHYV
jgi:hypothetical protein